MPHDRPPGVALVGVGNVGSAFLDLLAERRPPLRLVAVADSGGVLLGEIDPAEARARKERGSLEGGAPRIEALLEAGTDVLVDATGCDFETGEPALSLIREALLSGAAVATANKAPLAREWRALRDAAESGRRLRYGAAAGAALPAAAVAATLARMDEVETVEGVLTGTTGFVLDELAAGRTLDEAVAAAQEAGIAEPDPRVDLGGWDTAAKLVILANTLWPDAGLSLDEVPVEGVDGVDGSRKGLVRIVGRASRSPEGVTADVGPVSLGADHPLGTLSGPEKGVVFSGPAIGTVTIQGGRSHPRGAAAALLADALDLVGGSA